MAVGSNANAYHWASHSPILLRSLLSPSSPTKKERCQFGASIGKSIEHSGWLLDRWLMVWRCRWPRFCFCFCAGWWRWPFSSFAKIPSMQVASWYSHYFLPWMLLLLPPQRNETIMMIDIKQALCGSCDVRLCGCIYVVVGSSAESKIFDKLTNHWVIRYMKDTTHLSSHLSVQNSLRIEQCARAKLSPKVQLGLISLSS